MSETQKLREKMAGQVCCATIWKVEVKTQVVLLVLSRGASQFIKTHRQELEMDLINV